MPNAGPGKSKLVRRNLLEGILDGKFLDFLTSKRWLIRQATKLCAMEAACIKMPKFFATAGKTSMEEQLSGNEAFYNSTTSFVINQGFGKAIWN